MLISCLFAVLSILLICLNFARDTVYNKVVLYSGLAIPTALIIYTAVKFFLEPEKTTSKIIYPDAILTTAIVAFNVALVAFAINLLLNISFANLSVIMFSFILPIIWSVIAIAYFAIRWFFAKIKFFEIKNNH